MYCKKCGQFIGTDEDLCKECKQREPAVNVNSAPQNSNQYQSKTYYQAQVVTQNSSAISLGKSIAAIILSTVGFIFFYISLLAAAESEEAASHVCMIIGLVATIMGFVFGITSISNFKRTAHIRSGKRIPLLILGIASVVNASIGLLILFSIFLLVLAILA